MAAETYLKKQAKRILKAAALGISAITLSITLSNPSCGGAQAEPAPRTTSKTASTLDEIVDYSPYETPPPEPEYAWPVQETEPNWNVLASCYGDRWMQADDGTMKKVFHNGIDIGIGEGTPVVAIADGTVVHSCEVAPECDCSTKYNPCKTECAGKKSCGGWGTAAIIQHEEQMFTQYIHLQRLANNVRAGQTVKKGQVIGYSGNTGVSVGPHLHFSVLNDWHIPRNADRRKYGRDPLELYAKRLDKLDLTRHNCGEAYVRLARN